MSGQESAPGIQQLQQRLQEADETEEGEIRQGPAQQENPPSTPAPHRAQQGNATTPQTSPQNMAVDPVYATDTTRLRVMNRENTQAFYHTPNQVGCPHLQEPGGVEEDSIPFEYVNASAQYPENGKWQVRGYEASAHEMSLGWNTTNAKRLKETPEKFVIVRPIFPRGMRGMDADDQYPNAVRDQLATMYPPLAEFNVMWAGSIADANSCAGKLVHGHRQGPDYVLIPDRDLLPIEFVDTLFKQRIWVFSDKLAFIAIDPVRAEASWYLASFSCSVPSDSMLTRSRVLSLVRCVVEGKNAMVNFAKTFTDASPPRNEKVRIREVLDTWDVRHIKVGSQHIWQLTGMPPRKEGQAEPHLKAKRDLLDIFAKVKWDDYALDFGLKLAFLDPAIAPMECDACGDIFHVVNTCPLITAPDWRGPRSAGAARGLARDSQGIGHMDNNGGGHRGGWGGRGGRGGHGGGYASRGGFHGGYEGRGGYGSGRGRGYRGY